MEYVIVIIIVLLFAGGVLYAFVPRLERGPGIIERFFPEKCEATGLTRDVYQTKITDALSKIPPDVKRAFELNTEMKTCFAEAEISTDLKRFALEAARPRLRTLGKLGTIKAFEEILGIYDESKSVFPDKEVWNAGELLLFARTLYWYGRKDQPRDDVLKEMSELVDLALEKKPKVEEEAELRYFEIHFLTGEKERKALKKFIEEFKDKPEPEIQLYVGLAQYDLGEDAIQALEAARKPSEKRFIVDTATFYVAGRYSVLRDYKKAVQAFESILNEEIVLFDSAVAVYALIPDSERNIKDCIIDERVKTKCLCRIQERVNMMTEDYCVDCKPIKICKGYKNPRICFDDPCYISETAYEDAHCDWPTIECSPQPLRKYRR